MNALSESECRAVAIAADELLSYVDTVGDDDRDEAKLRWAIRKLNAVLARCGHPELMAQP